MTAAEAFSLLTLPNATLAAQGTNQTGVLNLECITVAVPNASAPVDRDVYLLLRLDKIEAPIDPTSIVQRSDKPGWQTYTFRPTENNSSELVLSIPVDEKSPQHYLEDLETFESLLSQYAELRVPQPTQSRSTTPIIPPPEKNDIVGSAFPGAHGDLRGHLVAINEDTGEVIGQFDDSQFQVREDPKLHEKGHENDVVMIEVPDTRSGAQQDANALQMFVTAVPPEDQDWITKSAGMVSHAISTTTSLLLTTISTASNYYINHSKPSPHHPSQVAQRAPGAPPPPPSRTLVFLTSERTRRGLAGVHAVSGKAVEVSAKTVNKIDDMIRSAMGRKSRKPRHFAMSQGHRDVYANGASSSSSSTPHSYPSSGSGMLSPQSGYTSPMPRAPSPAGKSPHLEPAPPPYPGYHDDKAPSVRGRSPSPAPPLPPRTGSGLPQGYAAPQAGPSNPYGGAAPPPLPPRKPLTKKAKALLSLDLILSTIDHEARRLLDGGQNTVGNVVGHKYGPEARETSMLMTGTAKHVGLVYIDMKGIGRRALLKKAGTHWVKGKLHSGDSDHSQQGQQWQGQQGGQGPYQQGPYQQQYQNMGGPSQGYHGYGQPGGQGKH